MLYDWLSSALILALIGQCRTSIVWRKKDEHSIVWNTFWHCSWKSCIARATNRLVSNLLANNRLMRRLRWFPKLTVGCKPMRRQIVSTMYKSVNNSYDSRPNWTPLIPVTTISYHQYDSWKPLTYPSPKPTLTLTSHLGQNVGLGDEQTIHKNALE